MTQTRLPVSLPVFAGIILGIFCHSAQISGQVTLPGIGKDHEADQPVQVYLITYDHGGVVPWGTQHFKKYLGSAADWLERYPAFKIGLDNEAYAYDYLAKNDTALLVEIKYYLKKYEGRFGIGSCTYGQPLAQFVNEESNIRQIGYAINTEENVLNCRPSVYLMSEHAMHSQIPQILKGFGFKGAIMRTHFMMYGYNPTYNSPIGWWRGRDGSGIPAIPTYNGEGSAFGSDTEDNLILEVYPGPDCPLSLEDFRDKFSGISPLLASRADDSHLRQEALVKQYENNPGFRWLLAEEIFPVFPAPVDEYKTDPDDFHVRMPWGYCANEIWNMSRKAETKVLTAERIAAFESLLGGENHESTLHEAWKNLLIAQHHDIQICGILDESRKYLPASINLSDSIISTSMEHIASEMEGGKLGQITLFNPVSWPRRDWINTEIIVPAGKNNFRIMKNNKPVLFNILSVRNISGTKSAVASISLLADIPALSLESYAVTATGKTANNIQSISFDREKLSIETPFWIIQLDKNGGIASITGRKTGKTLTARQRSGFLTGVIDGKAAESAGTWIRDSVILTNNQLSVTEKGSIATIPYTITMKLNDLSPVISFEVKIHIANEKIGRVSDNTKETVSAFLHEEKLRFKVFPSTIIGTCGIRDLPFTIAETDNKYIEGSYWTAVSDGHAGMAFLNHGTMGSVREDDGGYSLPLAYSMYYIWRTVMLSGAYSYEFALLPFEGKWENAGLHQHALNYNFPIVARVTGKGKGKLGSQYRPFIINSGSVILSALYTEKGKPYLRFYESAGSESELILRNSDANLRFTGTDLEGNETGPADPPFIFTPWRIRTFAGQ